MLHVEKNNLLILQRAVLANDEMVDGWEFSPMMMATESYVERPNFFPVFPKATLGFSFERGLWLTWYGCLLWSHLKLLRSQLPAIFQAVTADTQLCVDSACLSFLVNGFSPVAAPFLRHWADILYSQDDRLLCFHVDDYLLLVLSLRSTPLHVWHH